MMVCTVAQHRECMLAYHNVYVYFKVKPWVSKKITDYIGEEEASLVDFVCEKVTSRTDPQKILSDIAMVCLFF